jgi:hypothetical protein
MRSRLRLPSLLEPRVLSRAGRFPPYLLTQGGCAKMGGVVSAKLFGKGGDGDEGTAKASRDGAALAPRSSAWRFPR